MLSKRDAQALVGMFFEEIRRALENGAKVKRSGFGNLDLRDNNQRPGRNTKTGEDIPITAWRVVTSRPVQKLIRLVVTSSPTDEHAEQAITSLNAVCATSHHHPIPH